MNIPNYDKNTVVGNLRDDIRDSIMAHNHYTITDSLLAELYPALFDGATLFVIPNGELSKSIAIVYEIVVDMLSKKCNRDTTVVAVGGGVVSDIAGFVSSIFMRGIDWVCVPTTLLSQVDASTGGKTGINVEKHKNILGTFWLPRQIYCDINILTTLDEQQWLSGVGEIIKTSLLNQELWEYIQDNLQLLMERDSKTTSTVVKACIAIKSQIVALDLHDSDVRQNLNLGHTIGHALESYDNFSLSHGEYVLLGIMIETTIFAAYIDAEYLDSIRLLLKKIAPPMPKFSPSRLANQATIDKKNSGNDIVFVVPINVGKVQRMTIRQDELCDALKVFVN
ncbi:MAG: 3-dehydroquinate synthase [Firmicutes bacterium]|nr:3-dehydroquinate synthase [Bacillota bacterium]MCL1953773.1 3-dehydroquinate synthase [Bacillota bacterium]